MVVGAARGVPAGIDVSEVVLDPSRVAAVRVVLPLAIRSRRVLDRVAGLGASSLGGCAGRVSLVTDESIIVVGSSTGMPARLGLTAGLCPHVVAYGATLAVDDLATDPIAQALPLQHGVTAVAFAGAPIRVGGRVVGAVAVVAGAPRRFSADDLALLEDLAGAVEHQLGRPAT